MHDIGVVGTDEMAAELADQLAAHGRKVVTAAGPGPSLAGCDFVFELSDDTGRQAKRSMLEALSGAISPTAVIAVAVDRTSVTDLSAGLDVANRIVGMHWVRRAGGGGVVELVRVEHGAGEPLAAVRAVLDELEIDTIEVNDRPGLLLDTLHLPLLNQAIQALDDGLATAEDLDLAAELGLGHAVGPLAAVDRWGLGSYAERASALFEETGDAWFAPPPVLRRLLQTARTGAPSPALNEGTKHEL